MATVKNGTIVGYDTASGKKLFTHTNRVLTVDGRSTLPLAGSSYAFYDKVYRVVGVRVGSTEELYEIDVREEWQ